MIYDLNIYDLLFKSLEMRGAGIYCLETIYPYNHSTV